MHRRGFIVGSLLLGACAPQGSRASDQPKEPKRRPSVIDVHCHAGKGLNFAKGDPIADPWTTYNDPKWVLQQADEAGIDQSVIFPIHNRTFEKANEEIASYVREHPRR